MGENSLDPPQSGEGSADCQPQTGEARTLEVERLFRDHNDSLIRFLSLRLHSRQEAREVAQEAYVRLLQLERTDVSSFVRAYLFRIAGNLAIDRLRRRATESRFREAEPVSDLFDRPPDPEALAAEGQRVQQIRGFLDELPHAVRDAFLLFRVEDLDQETIARRLGVTDRMVRNHITRALLYCRLRLDGHAPGEALARLKTGATPMTTPLRHEDPRLQRMEQAALWLQRMRTAADDERVVEAWLDWCQRDPLNQQAFDEIAAVWELSGHLADEPRAAPTAATATHSRRRLLAASLAGLGLASIAGGAWWLARATPDDVLSSEFSSPIGVNRAMTLADGSVLELGGGTRVTVAIGQRERRVELLQGELYVSVHHDAARPFSVNVDKLQVIATGTAFNVLRTSGRVTVTVAEGSVKALYEDQASTAPNLHVPAGQQLIHSRSSNNFITRQVDPRDASAWRTGWLHFRNEPLSEVIESVGRYTTRKIAIEDARVKAQLISGNAHIDGIEAWLQGLPHVAAVTVVERADGSLQIGPQTGSRSD